jgi:hypothetical protein
MADREGNRTGAERAALVAGLALATFHGGFLHKEAVVLIFMSGSVCLG